jgi:hypothetical protein
MNLVLAVISAAKGRFNEGFGVRGRRYKDKKNKMDGAKLGFHTHGNGEWNV